MCFLCTRLTCWNLPACPRLGGTNQHDQNRQLCLDGSRCILRSWLRDSYARHHQSGPGDFRTVGRAGYDVNWQLLPSNTLHLRGFSQERVLRDDPEGRLPGSQRSYWNPCRWRWSRRVCRKHTPRRSCWHGSGRGHRRDARALSQSGPCHVGADRSRSNTEPNDQTKASCCDST
jgi:hypothetical protein